MPPVAAASPPSDSGVVEVKSLVERATRAWTEEFSLAVRSHVDTSAHTAAAAAATKKNKNAEGE